MNNIYTTFSFFFLFLVSVYHADFEVARHSVRSHDAASGCQQQLCVCVVFLLLQLNCNSSRLYNSFTSGISAFQHIAKWKILLWLLLLLAHIQQSHWLPVTYFRVEYFNLHVTATNLNIVLSCIFTFFPILFM